MPCNFLLAPDSTHFAYADAVFCRFQSCFLTPVLLLEHHSALVEFYSLGVHCNYSYIMYPFVNFSYNFNFYFYSTSTMLIEKNFPVACSRTFPGPNAIILGVHLKNHSCGKLLKNLKDIDCTGLFLLSGMSPIKWRIDEKRWVKQIRRQYKLAMFDQLIFVSELRYSRMHCVRIAAAQYLSQSYWR